MKYNLGQTELRECQVGRLSGMGRSRKKGVGCSKAPDIIRPTHYYSIAVREEKK